MRGRCVMKIFIKNLYGIQDDKKAFYRKQGIGCFDFVNSIEFASDLTKEEVKNILNHSEWYLNQYNADKMGVEI